MTTHYGYDIDDWNTAKEEMRQAMIGRARVRGMIPYSDLCKQVTAITLEPHSHALAAMLGEISADEDAAGRGMLTVKRTQTKVTLVANQALRTPPSASELSSTSWRP